MIFLQFICFIGNRDILLQNWAAFASAWMWEVQIMRTRKREEITTFQEC